MDGYIFDRDGDGLGLCVFFSKTVMAMEMVKTVSSGDGDGVWS